MICRLLLVWGALSLSVARCGVMGPPVNYVDRAKLRQPAEAEQAPAAQTPQPAESAPKEKTQ